MFLKMMSALGLSLYLSGIAESQTPPRVPSSIQERVREATQEAVQDGRLREAITEAIDETSEEDGLLDVYYIHRNISCPSPYVVEVTSEIGDWTPSFQSMSSENPSLLEVRPYGGYGERLVCTYGQDIFQLHLAPPSDMPVCVVDGDSFNCRPEGDFLNRRDEQLVQPSNNVDLDYSFQGVANDFWYRADTPTQQVFEAIGTARLAQINVTSPERLSLEFCRNVIENAGRTSYTRQEMQPGHYYCFRSTSSRYGYFEVLGYEGQQAPYALRIRHVTWAPAG